MQPRVLGVDFGDVRIGIALSDPLGITAQPKLCLEERDIAAAAAAVAALAREHQVSEIVVGLPVNMNGSEGPRAKRSRQFGAELAKLLPDVSVRYWDERLTTSQASRLLRGSGASSRKAKIDMVSAQILLQSYLDARSRSGG